MLFSLPCTSFLPRYVHVFDFLRPTNDNIRVLRVAALIASFLQNKSVQRHPKTRALGRHGFAMVRRKYRRRVRRNELNELDQFRKMTSYRCQ